MLDGNAHELAAGLAANVDPVVGDVDEDDVDVEGWEPDVGVERGDVLGDGLALRGGEGRGVREDAPEGHVCGKRGWWVDGEGEFMWDRGEDVWLYWCLKAD